ncbi:MAG TPA: hypothetical protein VFJ14_06445 [Nocardioidaceae bacterium]|nr:hypothetical protein [Nocardioidaceae bacterium]
MDPLLIVLVVACVLLAMATGALAAALLTLRGQATERQAAADAQITTLQEQVTALTARQADLEQERGPDRADPPADYVITFDRDEPVEVSTSRVVNATLGEPLIKAAALGHGVRRALDEDSRSQLVRQVRREYRRRRKATRAAARRAR